MVRSELLALGSSCHASRTRLAGRGLSAFSGVAGCAGCPGVCLARASGEWRHPGDREGSVLPGLMHGVPLGEPRGRRACAENTAQTPRRPHQNARSPALMHVLPVDPILSLFSVRPRCPMAGVCLRSCVLCRGDWQPQALRAGSAPVAEGGSRAAVGWSWWVRAAWQMASSGCSPRWQAVAERGRSCR